MTSLRFYRRIPLIPGLLYLNLSKRGISLSLGKRGLTVTLGRHGIRFTAGLPGTGLSASEQISYPLKKQQDDIHYDIQSFIGDSNGKKESK